MFAAFPSQMTLLGDFDDEYRATRQTSLATALAKLVRERARRQPPSAYFFWPQNPTPCRPTISR
jgi:hypothetical protein